MTSSFTDESHLLLTDISSTADLTRLKKSSRSCESTYSCQYFSTGFKPFIKASSSSSHSCQAMMMKSLVVVFSLLVLLPSLVFCAGPMTLNVRTDPGDSLKLLLLPAVSDPPLTVMFAFKTCRNVDLIRFYRTVGNVLIGTVSLRDSFLGFCMERPKRCENSEVKIALNEWHIVRISPYGIDNNQLLFQTFRPDGAFRALVPLESRVISFSSSLAAFYFPKASSGFYAEVPSSFRGCFSPSIGFDLQYIATSDDLHPLLGNETCFMDVAWPSKAARMPYVGECFVNVTCADGNVCQRCSVDEPEYCNCVFPYRPSLQLQPSDAVISQCSLVSSNTPCKNNPCRSGGTCVPRLNSETNQTTFQCVCPPLYTGALCDTPVDPCRPSPCLNKGVCIKDPETGKPNCQCHGTGFDGPFCERDIDECTVPNVTPCAPLNADKCYNLPGSYWCSCKAGFTNQTCSDPVNPCDKSLCKNGATCVPLETTSARGAVSANSRYVCTCPPGFGGQFCEVSYSSCNNFTCPFPNSVCFSSARGSTTCMCSANEFQLSRDKNLCFAADPCASMPCKRGTCRPVNAFVSTEVNCDCPPGYTGRLCETLIDKCQQATLPCRNGGTCVPSVGSFSCNCPDGFEPPYCDPIDYCALGVCKLNGSQTLRCENTPPGYKCVCKQGWAGVTCTMPIDPCASKPCLNGGLCQVTRPGTFKCVCPVGYSGKFCNEVPITSLCDSNQCLNGGTCRPGYGPYEVCICKPGWLGLACETRDPCYPNPCGEHGQCYELQDPNISYRCRCYDGWGGPNCTTKTSTVSAALSACANDSYCEPGGRCQDGICVCNKATFNLSTPFNSTLASRVIEVGWTGVRCTQPIIPDPCAEYPPICKNGARCTRHDPENSLGFFCNCGRVMTNTDFQYTGGRCEEIMGQYCHLSLCQNGGTCVPSGEGATCICPSGYTGKNCEQTISICSSGKNGGSPCFNGGTCVQGSISDAGNFTCRCSPGFSGLFCEGRKDLCIPNPCKNDGICSTKMAPQQPASFSCDCSHTGFTGPTCEVQMNLCSSDICKNGGSCIQMGGRISCKCIEGYGGESCQTSLDPCSIQPNPCQSGSTCVRADPIRSPLSYKCICPPGLTGSFCEQQINYCANVTCLHGGDCVNDKNTFHCICQPGFTGTYCDSDIDECKLFSPCVQSGAPCKNTMGSYECDCRSISTRWVDGKNCTVPLTGCNAKNLCLNGGTCTPILVDEKRNIHDFYCLCPLSWTGTYCETANIVSFFGNASMTYRKLVKDLPLRLSFDFRTTIADGPLLDVVLFDSHESAAKSTGLPIMSLYMLRGYLRGFLLQRTAQFAFPYSAANDVWTPLELSLSDEGDGVLKITQSTCDFPYCRYMFNASAINGIIKPESSQILEFSFGSRVFPTQNGFVGCLRNISVNSDLVITSPATLSRNTKIGCRQDGLCNQGSNVCNGNGYCKDRWVRTECQCFPGFDGPSCSQHLPKYTLGYVNGDAKNIRFLPLPSFTYPVDFVVAFRPSPTIGNISTQLLTVAFASNQSQVGFMFVMFNGMLLVNGEVKFGSITAGNQHVLKVSLIPSGSSISVKAKLNESTILTHEMPAGSAALRYIILGVSSPDTAIDVYRQKREAAPAPIRGGYFVVDMVEVNGNRLSLSSATLGGLTIDASHSFASEYIPTVCKPVGPCANGGICKESMADGFQCQCTKGFTGRTCSEPQPCDYVNCPASLNCVSKSADKAYCAGSISLDGYREFAEFSTDYTSRTFDSKVYPFKVHFDFRTKQQNGILLFAVAKNVGRFVIIEMARGNLVLSHNIPSSNDIRDGQQSSLLSEQVLQLGSVIDGSWNTLDLEAVNTMSGSQLRLRIVRPGASEEHLLVSGVFPFSTSPPFYASTGFSLFVGGVPSDIYSKYRNYLTTRWNMTMCIKNATYADTPLVTVMPRSLSTRFGSYQASSLIYGFDQLLSVSDRAAFSYGCPPSSPCSTSPDLAVCQNRGTCVPQWYDDYSCDCPVGFTGKYCQQLVSACAPINPCGIGSSCYDLIGGGYRCSCPAGKTGERCEAVIATTPAQPFFATNICMTQKPCANKGRCFATPETKQGGYRCLCDGTGFGGENCTVPLSKTCSADSEAPCLSGGVCINVTSTGPESANFSCSCPNGFYGLVCEFTVDWCAENNCLNGAKCVPQPQDQNYSCVCTPGFTGSMCQIKMDYCASNPCFNKGVCSSTEVGYNCACQNGFYGANCQLRNASVCMNNPCPIGKCVETPDNYTCDCSGISGYDPVTCEDIDECKMYSPCKNSVGCANSVGDYFCECSLGYGGKNCTEVNCSAVNCNHGFCQITGNSWRCQCDEFYHGPFCNMPSKCASRPCVNGTCIESSIDLYNSYRCNCNAGWLNTNCSTRNCSLEANYCNGGRCTMFNESDVWIPQCECPTGWSSASLCAEQLKGSELPPEWIWAPIVAVVAAAVLIGTVLLFLRIKQKRATGGNYSPSRQEAIGTRVELEDIIKPPPEERLI